MTSQSERRHREATPKHDGNQGRCPAAQAFPDETPGAGAAPSLVTAVTPATSRPCVQRFGPSARQTMAGRRTGRAFHSNTLGTLRGLGPTGVQGRPSSALQTRRRHLAPSSAMSDPGRKLGGCPGSQGPPGEGRSQSLTPAPSRPSRDHTVSFLLLAAGPPRVRAGPAGLPAASARPNAGRPASAQRDLAQDCGPAPALLSPALPRGARWPEASASRAGRTGSALQPAFQNETRNRVSSFEPREDSLSAQRPPPRRTHMRAWGPHPRRGRGGPPRGHRGGKTIPRVASKKSEVQDTAREQLSAKPAHRRSAPRAAPCQTAAGPVASRHGVTRGPRSGAEARLRRAPQCRDLLCVSQNKRPSGPRSPFSLRPPTFSFSA